MQKNGVVCNQRGKCVKDKPAALCLDLLNARAANGSYAYVQGPATHYTLMNLSGSPQPDPQSRRKFGHTGRILGLFSKIGVFVVGLIAASLPITGFLIWWDRWQKARQKQALPAGKSRLARV